uniref:Uncharacterized protein n=1 Tax=Ditylenchus dipsaci TaxID=166011 RepID=A0A915DVW3_9BILA
MQLVNRLVTLTMLVKTISSSISGLLASAIHLDAGEIIFDCAAFFFGSITLIFNLLAVLLCLHDIWNEKKSNSRYFSLLGLR